MTENTLIRKIFNEINLKFKSFKLKMISNFCMSWLASYQNFSDYVQTFPIMYIRRNTQHIIIIITIIIIILKKCYYY